MKRHSLKPLRIIQVSLFRNLPTIRLSLSRFRRYYREIDVHVICPDPECEQFRTSIPGSDIEFIPESSILSFKEFREIADVELASSSYREEIRPRLGWYYQQVLKIAHLIDSVDRSGEPFLSWDADTIPLRRLQFFTGDHSVMYGSTEEFHEPYFQTARTILGDLPKHYLSCTVQFIGLTVAEKKFLLERLNRFYPRPKDLNCGQWIAHVVLKGVVSAHPEYNVSMISEQDLLGLSNMLLNPGSQIPILQLRWGIEGCLTNVQSFLAGTLGFHHVSYENPGEQHQRIQPWGSLKNLCAIAIKRSRELNSQGSKGARASKFINRGYQ